MPRFRFKYYKLGLVFEAEAPTPGEALAKIIEQEGGSTTSYNFEGEAYEEKGPPCFTDKNDDAANSAGGA